jgi:CPA2 family monovalent cation:H+ antiporter-2
MQVLNNYSYAVQGIQAGSTLRQVINKYLTIVLINGIVVVAVFMAAIRFLLPFLEKNISGEHLPGIITFIVSLGIATPFLWAIMAKRPARVAYRELWLDRKYSRGPLFIIEISRIILGILIIGYLLDRLFSPSVAVIIGLPVILVTVILFSTRTRKFYNKIELRFIDNLKANERSGNNAEQSGSVLSMQLRDDHEFKPWDVHIVEMQVNPNAAFLGKTLEELGWRERYGINISCIRRGNKFIFAPGRNDRVQAFDFLGIIGTDEQIQTFRNLIDSPGEDISAQLNTGEIVIGKIIIESGNKLRGQSIRNSGIRENTKGLVIGIERDKKRILNPSSDTVFEWGDIVWIAGDRESIQKYK